MKQDLMQNYTKILHRVAFLLNADGIINLHWKCVINFFGKNDVIDVVGNSFKQTEKKNTTFNSFWFGWHGILCVATYFL